MRKAARKRGARTANKYVQQLQIDAVLQAAERSGLLGEKTARIDARISPALIAAARRQTGIEGKSDLIVFALASIAL
jgi:hypothetical protein